MKTTKHEMTNKNYFGVGAGRKMTFSLLILCTLLSSCKQSATPGAPSRDPKDPVTISRIVQSPEGKPYLEVDGEPFALYGAQIRIDIFRSVDEMEWSDIEPYFETAANLGLNCVQVPLPWKFIEPKEGEYVFSEADRIMILANKYNLKVELLWFSTNFIGDSYTWLVPQYVLAKAALRMKRDGDGNFHALYGYTYSIRFDDPWVLERERLALTALFAHIRDWDDDNGNRHPIITCQVHNEPDALVRWRIAEKNICNKDGSPLSKTDGWQMTLTALNAAGKAVKASEYRVATRTNIISGNGVMDFPQTPGISPRDVAMQEGIDFVSFDPYMQTVNQIASEVAAYASLAGNYPLIAENRGDFANTASLMLAASALGGGYDIYDLATSPYITSHSAPPFDTEGIYYSDLRPKPQVEQVQALLKGLIAANKDVALTPVKDFAAFNIQTDTPKTSCQQQIRTSGAVLDFETSSGALAFVLDRGTRLVAFSTASATLRVSGGTVEGHSDGRVTLSPGVVVELKYQSAGAQTSTTKKNIGTVFN